MEMNNYVPRGYVDLEHDIAITKARGSILRDLNGKKYYDLSSGIFTNSFGHCYWPLVWAAVKQKLLMDNVHGRRTPAELLFYRQLAEYMPENDYRFIPYNDGGYAIDRGLTDIVNHFDGKRIGIGVFRGAFHGKTMATKLIFNETVKPALFNNIQIDFPYCYRCPKSSSCRNIDCLPDILSQLAQGGVSVLLFEPILGAAGVIIPPEQFWEKIAIFCKSRGILLFADEVLTGGGRTGHFLASSGKYGMTPDIIALTKGLANGHPLSVLCERQYITENEYAARVWERSSTFAAHPMGLAIAAASLGQLKKHNIFTHVRILEDEFGGALTRIKESCCYVGDVRFIGLMGAIEFVEDRNSKVPFPAFASKVFERCRQNGLEVIPGGHIIRLAPPLNIDEKTLAAAMSLLRRSIQDVKL